MSDKPNDPPETDDPQVRRIRQLVRLMQRFDLTAIDLDDTATKIKLRRRGAEVVMAPAAIAAGPAPTPAPLAPATPAVSPPTATAATAPRVFIESPMVGTFYSSPAPDAPPFVQVGQTVRQDSTVCIIEAMKVFTDIPAGVSGTITEILVKNGESVEFGQPMFRVNPS